MIYIRAIEDDFKSWGLKSWTWEKLLHHYIELEDYCNDLEGGELPWYHGKGQGLCTSKAPFIDPIAPEFISSAINYGITFTRDFNNPSTRHGVGYYDFNIRNGLRDSAVGRFLVPIMNHKNLNIQTHATVRRVLLKRINENANHENGNGFESHMAYGVEYVQDGIVKTAFIGRSQLASQNFEQKGVVVTAGALLTPKILMNRYARVSPKLQYTLLLHFHLPSPFH